MPPFFHHLPRHLRVRVPRVPHHYLPFEPLRPQAVQELQKRLVLPPLHPGLGQGGLEVQGQDLHEPDLGALPLAASPEVLPVHHQDPSQVHLGEDLEEGLLELLWVQTVKEEGEDGVARGLRRPRWGKR